MRGMAPFHHPSHHPLFHRLLTASVLIGLSVTGASPAWAASERFYTFDHVQQEYLARVDHRIVRERNGQDILESRHRQYSRACFFFSIGMITEYLGYGRFAADARLHLPFPYATDQARNASTDVGYFASTEYLMADYSSWNSMREPPPPDEQGTQRFIYQDLFNPHAEAVCRSRFRDGSNDGAVPAAYRGVHDLDVYGQCTSLADHYERWLDYTGSGCSGASCEPDAHEGMFGYLNRHSAVGCNDARYFAAGSEGQVDELRRIVKAFVDHNVPLVMGSRRGQHFLTIIGYAELGADGLPLALIASNPHLTRDVGFTPPSPPLPATAPGPRPKFWVFHDLDQLSTWTDATSSLDAFFGNVHMIMPWNQHLDGGCDTGGWARELDDALAGDSIHRLCTLPAGFVPHCTAPSFGVELKCLRDGSTHRSYHADPGDPFLIEPRNTTCDDVVMVYADGTARQLTSAEITRYTYRDGRWWPLQSWGADAVHNRPHFAGRVGNLARAEWTTAWPENYWWVAAGLDSADSGRRVRIRLHLDDGSALDVEVAPPATYGVALTCWRGGAPHREYFVEPDRNFFQDGTFVFEGHNTTCDEVHLVANFGTGREVTTARISRFGRRADSGEWQRFQRWWADELHTSTVGLSADSTEVSWTTSWPDNYFWTARGLTGAFEGRKVEIDLSLADGSTRVIAVVPPTPAVSLSLVGLPAAPPTPAPHMEPEAIGEGG